MEKPGGAVRRDRVLTDEELVKVWRASDQLGAYGPAIKLLILTGARREEIAKLRRNEIDGNFITLSGERTKNGEPHIIPLSTAALSVLGDIQQGDGFVFAAGLPDWSHSKKELDKLAEIQAWHIHDLRRTAATGLQRLGIALQVTEAVLGHTSGSRACIIGVYQRHDYAAEKRAARGRGAHVMALVEGREPGKVVAFGGKVMPSGGRRAGAGRKSPLGGKVERLLIASKIATALRTLGPPIEDPELPYEDIAASQSVLAQFPPGERKRFSKDAEQHLDWLADVTQKEAREICSAPDTF